MGQRDVEKAEQAFDAGRYAEALGLFQRAEAESPHCDLLFYIGLTQYRLQDVDEAITSFASSVVCNPRLGLAEHALGDAYLAKGDDNRALAAYEAALKIQPDDPDALRAASLLCLKHELNTRAIPLLEQFIKVRPEDLDARSDLGSAYGAMGEFDKAEKQFRAALAVNSEAPAAVLGLGALDLKINRNVEAIPLLREAAQLAPNAAKPFYLLGVAYNRAGRYTEALAALEQAASRSPDNADTYYQLAHAYGHLQRLSEKEKAIARFTEIKARNERLIESQREAARLVIEVQPFVDQNDTVTALQMMEKAYQLDPENEEVWFQLGSLYYETQKYDLTRGFAERLVIRAPSEWRYLYLLGLVQVATGQSGQARASLEQVVQLHPSMAEAYNELGNLAMEESQPARAVKAYQHALETSPQNSAYRENLEAAQRAAARQN